MKLSEIIRGRVATATLATVATVTHERRQSVASVAGVAVAKPTDDKSTTYRCWLIHFADRDPMEVHCTPGATHAEILEWYAQAIAAQPFAMQETIEVEA
ncbi:MAG: hypothetical protein WB870_06860 [Gallionellaceae bacterium]